MSAEEILEHFLFLWLHGKRVGSWKLKEFIFGGSNLFFYFFFEMEKFDLKLFAVSKKIKVSLAQQKIDFVFINFLIMEKK